MQVEEIEDRGDVVAVRALLWVETESQKGIVIGAGGRMIKAIGSAARRELERELGVRVHLDLSVRVRRSWRVRESTCSRTSSASSTSSGWSDTSPGGAVLLPAGSRPARWRTSGSTPEPVRAETGNTSASSPKSAAACSAATVRGWSRRSILLTATTTGTVLRESASAIQRSPAPPTPCSPLTTISAASASRSSCSTRCCMRRVSSSRGRCTPGRSVSTSCTSSRVATPRIARRVVWGLSETIATLRPTIALTSVDLPTFGRPASATKPDRVPSSATPRSPPAGPASPRRPSRDPSRRDGVPRARPLL